MSDNTTSSSSSNNNDDSGTDSAELVVAVVALVIAIISFVVTGAQALQQYAASAEGYRRCAPDVMGEWAQSTRRTLRWREARFDVTFETPVLLLAPPQNDRGPIPDRRLYNIDGHTEIFPLKRSWRKSSRKDAILKKDTSRVHTADDERASWVNLLASLGRLEFEGRNWDLENSTSPKGYKRIEHTIIVQVQRRKRNWDFMPDSVVKPYATSTVTHILEMAVLLGMSWKTVDSDSGVWRAEGNGMSISSTSIQGLGLVVSFAVTSRSDFGKTRIIPCIELKSLIFGVVPSVFIDALEFGDDRRIHRTLRALRCKRDNVNQYIERRDHVRSLSFEVISMLAKVFRLRGSSLRMLPNPTRDLWTKDLSACTLMEQFQKEITNLEEPFSAFNQVRVIQAEWKGRLGKVWQSEESQIDIHLLEAAHAVVDACDKFLESCGSDAVLTVVSTHISTVVEELADSGSFLGSRDYDSEADIFSEYFKRILPKCAELTPQAHKSMIDQTITKVDLAEIWLTLQFRGCCWLLLHDFQEDPVVADPAMQGSRLPVFIL